MESLERRRTRLRSQSQLSLEIVDGGARQELTGKSPERNAVHSVSENEIGKGDPLTNIDSYLSPENAARYLDVSRKFIYEMIARKDIHAVSVGRLRRIRISTLEEWLNRSQKRR